MSTFNNTKLTKSLVDKQPFTESGQKFYRDSELHGFGLKVGQKTKTYIVEARVKKTGKSIRKTIGSYEVFNPDEARAIAKKMLGKMAEGINPHDEGKEAKAKSLTLEQVYQQYKGIRKLKPSTLKNSDYILKQVFSDWHDKPLSEITRDMVLKRHGEVAKNSGANHADNAMERLRTIYSFAIPKYRNSKDEPLIKMNPVLVLSETKALSKKKRRDTLIKQTELKRWFAAVVKLENTPDSDKVESVRDLLILLILTGMRKQEALKLKWSDVDFDEEAIYLKDTKNHLNHTVPMSDFVTMMMRHRQSQSKGGFVFSGDSKKGYMVEPRNHLRKVIKASGVKFMLHDLRRNFITAASLLLPSYVAKKLVNHVDKAGDVTAGYIHYSVKMLQENTQKVTDYFLQEFGIEKPLADNYLAVINSIKHNNTD